MEIWKKKKHLCSDSIYKKYIFYEKSNYHIYHKMLLLKFWVFCLRPLPLILVLIFCGEGVMRWKILAGLKVSYDKFNKNYCIINEVQIYTTASSKDFDMNLM